MLEAVKKRLKIYYYDPEKDAEIQGYIDEAEAYLKAAGAQERYFDTENPDPLAIGAVSLYVKMAMESDPKVMGHNPILLSMISQMKYIPERED
jgi:hypothetical protein